MLDYVLLEKYAKDIKVLFVEDDEAIRKEVYELLLNVFPNVDIAVDGEDGLKSYLDFYKKEKAFYDLIITDIKMPKLDGIELSKKIYENNKEQELIVLSAYNDKEYLMKFINMGISQFITKPIQVDEFINVIFNISEKIYLKKPKEKIEEIIEIYLNKNLFWNKETKKLTNNEENIKLTKKEILLIDLLLKEQRTYSIDEIIKNLWLDDEDIIADSKNLKNIIFRLKKKIPELKINNIYGLGYSLDKNK